MTAKPTQQQLRRKHGPSAAALITGRQADRQRATAAEDARQERRAQFESLSPEERRRVVQKDLDDLGWGD